MGYKMDDEWNGCVVMVVVMVDGLMCWVFVEVLLGFCWVSVGWLGGWVSNTV